MRFNPDAPTRCNRAPRILTMVFKVFVVGHWGKGQTSAVEIAILDMARVI